MRLALLFDFDGTLSPIVDHPRLAVLDPGIRAALEDLLARPRVSVGVLSGRALCDLKRAVGLAGPFYVGSGGLEVEIDGAVVVDPSSAGAAPLVENLASRLESAVRGFAGAWIERKPLTLAVHHRGVAPERSPALRSGVERIIKEHEGCWRVVEGPMAIEVSPEGGWTKGTAVRRICEALRPDPFPVYAGDHRNDAEALEAAADLGGISIGIGGDAPACARYRLPDPPALGGLLQMLAKTIESPST